MEEEARIGKGGEEKENSRRQMREVKRNGRRWKS